ncbi:tyrosine-type recombinase/integrase [Psychroflexus salis]|uniref:Integrase n=1 Tax=Psychroflexus salis TaxID=1526574 RepID=A0A916ZV94_9FLAO|nr:tyrosine-type recombinase/integrase [Psychroflexus salis]GGE15494.1 integrase [Psychroflexus salis]
MKTKFKLRKGSKTNTILLDFRHGASIRVRFSTQINISKGHEKFWDDKKQRIKKPSSIINDTEINKKLNDIELDIESKVVDLIGQKKLSQKNCKHEIKKILGLEDEEESENQLPKKVLDYMDWYLKYYTINNSPTTKKPLGKGTLKSYKNMRSYFNRYLRSRKIKDFVFEDMNEEFYNDFIKFGNQKHYSRNYIGSMIQKLKTIIGSAYDNDVHENREFQKRYFSKFSEEVNHPYLTVEELDKIFNLKLNLEIERNVRDAFLIACYTGMRVQDLFLFLKEPKLISEGKRDYIHMKQQKTGNEVYIPINEKIKRIIKRRNGEFPPKIDPSVISKYIKSISKKAKINDEYTLIKTIGGSVKKITEPKYKFISSHTARRSFCTNAYNAGVAPHKIMAISGHKTEKVFYNYIKASAKFKARQIAEHSFFN